MPPAAESASNQESSVSRRAAPEPGDPGAPGGGRAGTDGEGRATGSAGDEAAHDDARAVVALLTTDLLRFTAIIGIVAGALGRTVVPGLRGNAPERTVLLWERITSILSYAFWLLLSSLVVRSALEIGRQGRAGHLTRLVSMAGAGIVVAVVLRSLAGRLEVPLALAVASGSILVALCGALRGLTAPTTRAVSAVLLLVATSALLRLAAWQLAAVAGDRANPALYDAGRVVATLAVVMEGIGQLVGATWIGTRSRIRGQLLATLAVAGAFAITWAAARGARPGASFLEAMLHHGLADAPGVPPPYQLGAFATFLVPSGTLLAFAAVVQWSPLAAIPAAASLALLAHGTYDVPLRALAATAAGQWLLLAAVEPRALWVGLTGASPKARSPG